MATIAEIYGFGARAVYATPRASEYDMKERVRLSGMFPRVGNEPLSKALARIVEEFEQNANFAAIVERHRALIDRARVGRAIGDANATAVQTVLGKHPVVAPIAIVNSSTTSRFVRPEDANSAEEEAPSPTNFFARPKQRRAIINSSTTSRLARPEDANSADEEAPSPTNFFARPKQRR